MMNDVIRMQFKETEGWEHLIEETKNKVVSLLDYHQHVYFVPPYFNAMVDENIIPNIQMDYTLVKSICERFKSVFAIGTNMGNYAKVCGENFSYGGINRELSQPIKEILPEHDLFLIIDYSENKVTRSYKNQKILLDIAKENGIKVIFMDTPYEGRVKPLASVRMHELAIHLPNLGWYIPDDLGKEAPEWMVGKFSNTGSPE